MTYYFNDNTANRIYSTFIIGFLSVSGSINCNQYFNNIPVSNFNQLLTLGSTINSLSGLIFLKAAQGIKGDVGATGGQGIQGNVGATGGQGIQGNVGATGQTGSSGASQLGTDNIWTGIQSFSQPIYQNINNNQVVNIGSGNLINNSSGYGNVVVGFSSVKVANNNSNVSFGSFNLNSVTSGNNTALGNYCFYSATSGDNLCGIGNSVFYRCIVGRNNSGLGDQAGYFMLGSNNTCIGALSGQSRLDTSVYNNSTAIGFYSIVNASNQIMLGTANETVYIPNALILAGTNILTTISSSINNILPNIYNTISTSITNFKASNNTFSGINTFGDNKIFCRDANHWIGGFSSLVNGPSMYGYYGVEFGYTSPSKTTKLTISAEGLKMGLATLTNDIWSYLSTITSNVQTSITNMQNAISDLQSGSGRTIQTQIFCGPNYNLANTSINNGNSNNANVLLFSVLFSCKASPSILYITFDAKYGVNGGGTDSLTSLITVDNGTTISTIAKKLVNYGIDNRNCDINLFPICGAFVNTGPIGQRYRLNIYVFLTATDDTLTLDNNLWSYKVTEYKN
jgi:hypothetical protein